MHRDLKPGNIILRTNWRAVLIDFGSSRDTGSGSTHTFTQIYSTGYAPLEQMLGVRQGPFPDIYAIGAVCYHAIGGKMVDAITRHHALSAGRADPLPSAQQVGSGRYPVSLLQAIDAALVVNSVQRPQNVSALTAILGNGKTEDDVTVRVPNRCRGRRNHRWLQWRRPPHAEGAKPQPDGRRHGGGLVRWCLAPGCFSVSHALENRLGTNHRKRQSSPAGDHNHTPGNPQNLRKRGVRRLHRSNLGPLGGWIVTSWQGPNGPGCSALTNLTTTGQRAKGFLTVVRYTYHPGNPWDDGVFITMQVQQPAP